jgi:signal transduction histidine kinase
MVKPTNTMPTSNRQRDSAGSTSAGEPLTADHLRFSTEMLRRLGEELNPHADQGILELVRNAYDADATECAVELIDTHVSGGTVRVADNGIGMTVDGIRKGWLILGTSEKVSIRQTGRKRFPIGNKGIGRLAALRLGRAAQLTTRSAEEPKVEHQLVINWNVFDQAKIVDEVPLQIQTFARSVKSKNGTVVEINDLRTHLAKADVKRLARALVLLADPFGDDSSAGGVTDFRPVLKVPEFADLEKLVARGYRDEADYYLHAELDRNGRASAVVTGYNGDELFRAGHNEITSTKGNPPYLAPAAIFDLWWFVLTAASFSPRAVTLGEVREWLREFGGVHLYHRGLRVSPYSDLDWLDMNLRRVRSPELRPSTNTSIGRVAVLDEGGALRPKTDRVGFVEDATFESLRRFVSDVLEWFAYQMLRRWEERRGNQKERTARKVRRAQQTLNAAIEEVPDGPKEKVQEAIDEYERARDEEAGTLRKDLQLYRTLSTVGTTAAAFAHQAKSPLAHIESSAATLEEALDDAADLFQKQTMMELAAGIRRDAESLLAFAKVTLGLLQHEKRRRGLVSIHASVVDVVTLLKPYIDLRKVTVQQDLLADDDKVLASRAALECIFTNLLINSLKAFERCPPRKRLVMIRTRNIQEHAAKGRSYVELGVLDNGPGIGGISIDDIWLPGRTTTTEGTGLGLTIVKDVVTELGGKVAAVAQGELGGAEMIINIPVRRRQ